MFDGATLNGTTLNDFVGLTGAGQDVAIEQNVAILGSGLMISITQRVEYLETGSGLIISIEQNIAPTASGLIISIEQRVRTQAVNTFYSRNGYDVDIFIGGYQIPKARISGNLTIHKAEGQAANASFTIIPTPGVQSPETYQGKPVYINATTSSGVSRLFTGFCDTPHIDLVENRISFDCTDRRTSQLNNTSPAIVDSIGLYSESVFGLAKDQADELDKRLSTIPYSYDYNNYGIGVLTAWAPKTTADFVLDDADIYYDAPMVNYTNRTQTLNTINITVNYTFQRLHQQLVNISWPGYNSFCLDYYNVGRASFPTRDMVEGSANGSGWKTLGSITYTDLWAAAGFSCAGITGENVGRSNTPIAWNPDQVTYEYAQKMGTELLVSPSTGAAISANGISPTTVDRPVLDSNGNPTYEISRITVTNTSSGLCRGCHWTAARKFAQNVKQTYTMTLRSPQAITRFGVISTDLRTDIIDSYDATRWEQEPTVYNSATNFFVDQKTNGADLQAALVVSFYKARTDILKAHRDVSVNFRRGLWPQIGLEHTVQTTADKVACKGKVGSYTHTIDCASGEAQTEVSLLLSRSFGGDTETAYGIAAPTDDTSYIGSPPTVNLGTHLGMDLNTASGAAAWNGYVGNKTLYDRRTGYSRTTYTEAFIVDYPAILPAIRNDRVVSASGTYTIAIPNDSLVITT